MLGMEKEDFLSQLSLINWFGIAGGCLMLILPFVGAWWRFGAGTGVLELSLSPFYYSFTAVGESLSSQLVNYVILGAKLVAIIGGVFMITGSVASSRWWGRKLLKWGSLKVLWLLVSLLAVILIGTIFANEFLPSLLSQASGGGVSLNLPYLWGVGQAEIQMGEGAKLTAPLTAEFTPTFLLAIATVDLGIGARIYNGRISDKVQSRKRTEEKDSEKVEPEEEEREELEPEEEEETRRQSWK